MFDLKLDFKKEELLTELKYNPFVKMYVDSIAAKTNEGVKWSVDTNALYPGFTHTSTQGYPTFSAIGAIPDTLYRSQNYVINVSNAQNADFVEFIFDDLDFHPQVPWYRKLNLSQGSILSIPGSDFSLINKSNGLVKLVFTKSELKTINGKMFQFENRLMLVKSVVLIH